MWFRSGPGHGRGVEASGATRSRGSAAAFLGANSSDATAAS